ncbi:cell adhesion molecule 2-like [Lates japonicus]
MLCCVSTSCLRLRSSLQILRPEQAAVHSDSHSKPLHLGLYSIVDMNFHMTPLVPTSPRTRPPLSEHVTRIPATGYSSDSEALAALIGGIVGAVLLALICVIAVLLWCLSRQKGSYITGETDDDDDDVANDDESVGSDAALQGKKPLNIKEEE